MNEALDHVRAAESRKMAQDGYEPLLHKSRWCILKRKANLTSQQRFRPAHLALAKLEQTLGEHLFLCTQNVDDLHEQAASTNVTHMHGELFKSRCDTCSRLPFRETNTYDPPAELPQCECGGGIRPHICWFGEVPFELDRIFRALDECTVFMAVGTSGVVEPAASFVAHVRGRARTIYMGAEVPANACAFRECHLGKAGEVLPEFLALEAQEL